MSVVADWLEGSARAMGEWRSLELCKAACGLVYALHRRFNGNPTWLRHVCNEAGAVMAANLASSFAPSRLVTDSGDEAILTREGAV